MDVQAGKEVRGSINIRSIVFVVLAGTPLLVAALRCFLAWVRLTPDGTSLSFVQIDELHSHQVFVILYVFISFLQHPVLLLDTVDDCHVDGCKPLFRCIAHADCYLLLSIAFLAVCGAKMQRTAL